MSLSCLQVWSSVFFLCTQMCKPLFIFLRLKWGPVHSKWKWAATFWCCGMNHRRVESTTFHPLRNPYVPVSSKPQCCGSVEESWIKSPACAGHCWTGQTGWSWLPILLLPFGTYPLQRQGHKISQTVNQSLLVKSAASVKLNISV